MFYDQNYKILLKINIMYFIMIMNYSMDLGGIAKDQHKDHTNDQ